MRIDAWSVFAMSAGIHCYACNSYLGQCGERVDNSKGTVFRSRCSGPCFARRGEDDGELPTCSIGAAAQVTFACFCMRRVLIILV